jgi:hypothetical protein
MLNLLEALTRTFQFTVRRLLGLLDEGVQDDDSLADKKTVKGAADSRPPTRAQLKQTIAKGPRVGQTKARTMHR